MDEPYICPFWGDFDYRYSMIALLHSVGLFACKPLQPLQPSLPSLDNHDTFEDAF